MAETRYNYEKPDYVINYDEYDFLARAKQRLIDICENYIKDCGIFKNAQDLPARHVILELNRLDSRSITIPTTHVFSFNEVVLKSYIIALQEYLPKQSRLSISIKNFVNDFFPEQDFDNIKESYRKEIEQIKAYFSSFLFRQGSFQYTLDGGISVFYDAYRKLHPEIQTHSTNEIDLKTMNL